MLSYRHYRRDLRDKRHLGDECSPRGRDKNVSLQSQDFFRGPRISTSPARGRSRVQENGTKCDDYPCALHSSHQDLSQPVSSSEPDHLELAVGPGEMGSIGVALVKLDPDNGIGPVYKILHTPDAIRPFYKSPATTRGYVANLLAGASM